MTHVEIYRAWHKLPDYFKDEVRKDYAAAIEANELDPKNERIDAHIILLERYFGKFNLIASEDEPKFKVGDAARIAQNCEKSAEKGVSGNEDSEKDVDWLACRMELIKLMLPSIMANCNIDFMSEGAYDWGRCETIGYHVVKVADRIVKELNMLKVEEENGDC